LIGFGTDRQQAIMRLQRALYEYFVAGIKTNISLFQRILGDPDFQAARVDTGFLDRLLAKANPAVNSSRPPEEIEALEKIAAIAAGMFAVLDPASSVGENETAGGAGAAPPAVSNWRRQARSETLR